MTDVIRIRVSDEDGNTVWLGEGTTNESGKVWFPANFPAVDPGWGITTERIVVERDPEPPVKWLKGDSLAHRLGDIELRLGIHAEQISALMDAERDRTQPSDAPLVHGIEVPYSTAVLDQANWERMVEWLDPSRWASIGDPTSDLRFKAALDHLRSMAGHGLRGQEIPPAEGVIT